MFASELRSSCETCFLHVSRAFHVSDETCKRLRLQNLQLIFIGVSRYFKKIMFLCRFVRHLGPLRPDTGTFVMQKQANGVIKRDFRYKTLLRLIMALASPFRTADRRSHYSLVKDRRHVEPSGPRATRIAQSGHVANTKVRETLNFPLLA
jgi:hypothetical protein